MIYSKRDIEQKNLLESLEVNFYLDMDIDGALLQREHLQYTLVIKTFLYPIYKKIESNY